MKLIIIFQIVLSYNFIVCLVYITHLYIVNKLFYIINMDCLKNYKNYISFSKQKIHLSITQIKIIVVLIFKLGHIFLRKYHKIIKIAYHFLTL